MIYFNTILLLTRPGYQPKADIYPLPGANLFAGAIILRASSGYTHMPIYIPRPTIFYFYLFSKR